MVVSSPLFGEPCWRSVGWQRNPGVGRLLPHRDSRRGEIRIGKVSNGNGDKSGKAFALPVDRRAACRTKVKGQHVPAFGCPRPRRSLASDADLIAPKASLVADLRACAALAL
jgi:hypothetical protein